MLAEWQGPELRLSWGRQAPECWLEVEGVAGSRPAWVSSSICPCGASDGSHRLCHNSRARPTPLPLTGSLIFPDLFLVGPGPVYFLPRLDPAPTPSRDPSPTH